MDILKDKGIISEGVCGNNFEYILENSSYFVSTDYKVLQSQTNGVFIQCMKMIRNGKLDLYYITNDCRPMSSMFIGITADVLIALVVNLLASVIEVRNNGFLTCQCIDLSWDKIFVEKNTLKVKLVYIPLSIKAFDNYSEFESELRTNIVKLINNVIVEANERIKQIVSDLCNGSLTIEDVYNRSRNVSTLTIAKKERNSIKLHDNNASGMIKMVAMNAPKYFEILIDRSDVLIGKKQEMVDEVIPFNELISRKHCRIICNNGMYFLVDEDSTNGTFVNGVKVGPGQYCQINRGDIIRLADSDFQIV